MGLNELSGRGLEPGNCRSILDLDVRIDGPMLKNLFGKTMDEIYHAVFPTLSKEEQQKLGDICFEIRKQAS